MFPDPFLLKVSPPYASEEDFIFSLQEGRQEALDFLYDTYSPVILGLISKMVEDKEGAEEVFKASWVKIWEQKEAYDPQKGSFVFWLLSTTREVALGAIQSGRCHPWGQNGQSGARVTGKADKTGILQDKEKIQELSPPWGLGENLVFDLIFLKGYTCAEAAEELEISRKEVKSTFRFAIKEFRAEAKA